MTEQDNFIPRIFVAGPYEADNWVKLRNIERAREGGAQIAMAGGSPFIPHTNTAWMCSIRDPRWWYAAIRQWVSLCHGMLLLPGWQSSKGAVAEAELAGEMGIPKSIDPAQVVERAKLRLGRGAQ